MKKLIYTFVLFLIGSFASQAQNLTVQGNVANGNQGGVPYQLVYLQIDFSPMNVVYDSTFTDSLGNFQITYPVSANQGLGIVTATIICGTSTITSIDTFDLSNLTTNHPFNCVGSTPPTNFSLNGIVTPTSLGDSILMRLYQYPSSGGPILETSYYVVDTIGMGFVNYSIVVNRPDNYIISASSNNSFYYTTYYGNSTIQLQATTINAFPPINFYGLDIQLQTTPSLPITYFVGAVSGYTRSASGLDSLIAILIEVQNNIWTPVDTALMIDSLFGIGQYSFGTTNFGTHAILIRMLGQNAVNYAPTYHDNTTTWTATTTFSKNPNSNTLVHNITLQAASGTGSGSGSAGGGVFNGLPFTGSVGVEGMPVYLQNANGNLLKVAYSRTDGSYDFNNLPFGDYSMRVELAGVPSAPYMFSITSSNPDPQINFTIGFNGIAASLREADLTLVNTYPNPAKDWVRLQLKAKDGQDQTIRIRDMQGRLMLAKSVQLETGMQEIELSLHGLSQGVYLLEVTGSQKAVSRLVIQ